MEFRTTATRLHAMSAKGALLVGGVSLFLGVMTGCSSSDEASAAPAAPAAHVACVAVPAELIQGLNEGVSGVDSANKIVRAGAVKAPERADVYFVSGEIAGPGIGHNQVIATWAVGHSLRGDHGAILSVNGEATQFSDWADGASSDAAFSPDEAGVSDSAGCLE